MEFAYLSKISGDPVFLEKVRPSEGHSKERNERRKEMI